MRASDDLFVYPDYLLDLFNASESDALGLSFADFAAALIQTRSEYLPADAPVAKAIKFYRSLHLKDFALAQACSRRLPVAWELFIRRYRERIYAAALVLTKDEPAARNLADSVLGDLFTSAAQSDCPRLASYSGRGSLEGWLKAVLARAFVDRYRSRRRFVSLEHHLDTLKALCASDGLDADVPDPRLKEAIEETCLEWSAEDRFLLAAYFFDERTLAEIAAMIGVHESTVSRRMHRLLARLRRSIKRKLRDKGMGVREVEESLRSDVHDLALQLGGQLLRSKLT
jgi:RNA polymerase sigma-70 factor (ECF subfamily)